MTKQSENLDQPGWMNLLLFRGLRSLQFKASLFIVLLILLVSLAGMWLSLGATRRALLESESQQTYSWAVSLAASEADEVDSRDRSSLQIAVNHAIQMPGVAYAAFTDRHGNLLASAEAVAGLFPGLDLSGSDTTAIMLESMARPTLMHRSAANITCMDVVVPVWQPRNALPPNTNSGRLIGYLRFGTDISPMQNRLRRISAELGRIALGVVLLVVPCSLIATRRVVAPLHQLARAARDLANGALDARAPVHSLDEFGQVAHAFNGMADQVTRTQRALLELNAELERRVAQRTRDLEEQAARDPLTGLYNRRHFGEVITREFAAAERYGSDLTCLMFDVDHFKIINDRYGHRTGDSILIALAQAISAEQRGSDVAARFGGDEFILLLPQTTSAQASVLADRIMSRFAENAAAAVPGVKATLSIGVASLGTTRARSSEALMHEADVALYAAKEGGRNRTMEAVGTS